MAQLTPSLELGTDWLNSIRTRLNTLANAMKG